MSSSSLNNKMVVRFKKYDKLVALKDLKPHPKNRNSHPEDQVARLAAILKYQGVRLPITVSKQSGFITRGHGRLAAAKHLKWKEFPVVYMDYDDSDQEYADLQSDNAIALWSALDVDAIRQELGELDFSFDPDMLGIRDFNLSVTKEEPGCDEDATPEPPKKARTVLGDVYTLGKHRLMCGDSTSIDAVEKLMAGKKADMLFTDPPYGISINADYGSRMKGKEGFIKRNTKHYSDIIGDDSDFDPSFFLEYFSECKIFLWGANNYTQKLPKGQWLVWYKKTTDGMKRMFGWDFELCWTNQKAGSVYEQAWAGCFGHNKELDGATKTHPSMKSCSLVLKIFGDYPSHNVVDLFGGSGTTLIAAEKTNRQCFMMELDPKYCDVIVRRYCDYVGTNSVKLNGEKMKWVTT